MKHKTHVHPNSNEYVTLLVNQAAKFISPVWPIETFIACNPLHGFEDIHFDEAMVKSHLLQRQGIIQDGLEAVNIEMIKWSGAFLDMGQGSIEMPKREQGFYLNFCDLAIFDRKLHLGKSENKAFISTFPDSAAICILQCLSYLKIEKQDHHDFLVQNFAYLPGWAGYVKWLSVWHNAKHLSQKFPINLVEYIAVRLAITCLLWKDISLEKKKQLPSLDIQAQLDAIKKNEAMYQQQIIQKLRTSTAHQHQLIRQDMQMVFCIDVRSEPFRRKLEQKGAYETLGFAGFFGLAVRIHDTTRQQSKDCCPALIEPQYDIHTQLDATSKEITQFNTRKDFVDSFVNAYQQLKYNVVTPFNLADAMGPWCGIAMFMRNFFPGVVEKALASVQAKIWPPIKTTIQPKLNGPFGIAEDEQLKLALTALRLMGLVQNFAKIVVFCGHKSTTSNNPYASALDCGACGGNHGDQNAQLLAAILNQSAIRQKLKNNGIEIPDDTVFLGAVHDTTNDDCEIFSNKLGPHQVLLETIRADLKIVQQENQTFRAQYFSNPTQLGLKRTHNWSELRPEWGLARNAAFIVAPRKISAHIDLKARSFLHSYDWEIDKDGSLLETILTAPMVVAQWINTQYLFSTLDNVNYGSGNKITHNVTGKIGVMQGNGSDLMHGLSLQSVKMNNETAFHVPQRLLTIVYAPTDLLMSIINRHEVLQKLFYHEWVKLICFCPKSSLFYQLNSDKTWTELSDNEG
ncbi:MAG: DUF2309 domain-containing protein [Gammaproteobacteria bacterium]|nr:DUF2309 domain-containing protein [Gammaproteobacteria bacterium]